MTGYGRAAVNYKDKVISVEIKSLNSKFTDLKFKMPQTYRELELTLRRLISERIDRGKIDVVIDTKSTQGEDEYGINFPLFRRYYRDLKALCDELSIPDGDLVQSILRLPNVVASGSDLVEEDEANALFEAVELAFQEYNLFRQAEGKATEGQLRQNVKQIASLLEQVAPFEEQRIVRLRQKLHQNLEDYLGKEKIDENRFEQEILFYLEKMDVTEEKSRLAQHCNFFLEQLDSNDNNLGRKLSFISQEIGREINTLGAKSYSSDMQRLVVEMKDELEKIKEQVANCV